MNKTVFEGLLYSWIAGITSTTIIFANENGPRPELPYITILTRIASKKGSIPFYDRAANDGTQRIKYDIDYSLSLQCYGNSENDPITILQGLKDEMQKQSNLGYFYLSGLAIREDNEIQDISTLIDSTIEKRALWELIFGVGHEIIDDPNFIEKVEGSGDIDGNTIDINV